MILLSPGPAQSRLDACGRGRVGQHSPLGMVGGMWIWVTVSAAEERSWSEPLGRIKSSSLEPQRGYFTPHPTLHPAWPVSGPSLLYQPSRFPALALHLSPSSYFPGQSPKSVPRMHQEATDPRAVCLCSEGPLRMAVALSSGPDPQALRMESGLLAGYISLSPAWPHLAAQL